MGVKDHACQYLGKVIPSLLRKLRRNILTASYEAGACHLGSALSCIEIIATLYFHILKDEDIFLFSKASGAAALYCVLAEIGVIPQNMIANYLRNYPLASKEVPGVTHSVGSIGHGLSIACGIALGKRNSRVFCLMSDGECQEGSTYEAALFARQHRLTNLYAIIDNNGIQACGATKDILDLSTAFVFFKNTLPNVAIVNTIKGQGVSFMENDYTWHYKNLTAELLANALKEND
jgi:transketolase